MTEPNTPERAALIAKMERARADALLTAVEPSEYFLDKCGAEAGDFGADDDDAEPPRRRRSKVATFVRDFWTWLITPKAPTLEEAEARLKAAGPFYTDAQKSLLTSIPPEDQNLGMLPRRFERKK